MCAKILVVYFNINNSKDHFTGSDRYSRSEEFEDQGKAKKHTPPRNTTIAKTSSKPFRKLQLKCTTPTIKLNLMQQNYQPTTLI